MLKKVLSVDVLQSLEMYDAVASDDHHAYHSVVTARRAVDCLINYNIHEGIETSQDTCHL